MSDLGFLKELLDGAEVEWKPLDDVTLPTSNIRWANTDQAYRYIDLTSVDRETGTISEAKEITADTAPSRAQKLVETGDLIFATTRPAQQRFCLIPPEWSGEVASTGYCVLRPDQSKVLPGWLLHWVSSSQFKSYVEEHQSGSAYPAISDGKVKAFEIPIPCPKEPEKSLAIQREIVRILDSFTELTAELTAELELRKKQYNHYRDQLLTFEDGEVEWKPLSELVDTVTAPTKLNRSAYREKGALPIVDQGVDFLAGFTDEDVTPVSAGEYVIFGDHSEHIKFVDFAFVQGADGLKILKPRKMAAKFIFYAFTSHYRKEGKYKRHWSKAKDTLIPVPYPHDPERSLVEQNRIVAILDKFDTLTTSLSEGLPREIELRQKQYEYYRDLLLSFPKPAEAAEA